MQSSLQSSKLKLGGLFAKLEIKARRSLSKAQRSLFTETWQNRPRGFSFERRWKELRKMSLHSGYASLSWSVYVHIPSRSFK